MLVGIRCANCGKIHEYKSDSYITVYDKAFCSENCQIEFNWEREYEHQKRYKYEQ